MLIKKKHFIEVCYEFSLINIILEKLSISREILIVVIINTVKVFVVTPKMTKKS